MTDQFDTRALALELIDAIKGHDGKVDGRAGKDAIKYAFTTINESFQSTDDKVNALGELIANLAVAGSYLAWSHPRADILTQLRRWMFRY